MQPQEPNDDVSLNIPFLSDFSTTKTESPNLKKTVAITTGTASFFKTTFNGLNSLSGVGILSIPFALSSGGWLSLILLLIIAAATFYTGILIKRCMDVDHGIQSYPDIGERAFGAKGRALVTVFTNLELFLVATGFLIMVGDNAQSLLPSFELDICGITVGSRTIFVLIAATVIAPTVWIDSMATLSYVSATGVVASVVILGSVLWSAMGGGIGFRHGGELVSWSGLPTALSLYIFCYCAHPVFPTLYTSMKDQRQFSSVLLLCFSLCTVTYASMAILGYLMFGSELQSQITLNLPTDKMISKLAIYTTMVNPLAKYALMVTPIVKALERRFLMLHTTVIRSGLVVSTIAVALAVPFFAELMSLVGAFLNVTVCVILPCLCYMKISGSHGVELVWLCGIVFVGCVVVVVGTYIALLQILDHFIPSWII